MLCAGAPKKYAVKYVMPDGATKKKSSVTESIKII